MVDRDVRSHGRYESRASTAVDPWQRVLRVSRGERFGLVGSTDRSTGPLLLYEVRLDGAATDPLAWRRSDRMARVSSEGARDPRLLFRGHRSAGGRRRSSSNTTPDRPRCRFAMVTE